MYGNIDEVLTELESIIHSDPDPSQSALEASESEPEPSVEEGPPDEEEVDGRDPEDLISRALDHVRQLETALSGLKGVFKQLRALIDDDTDEQSITDDDVEGD